MTDMEVCSICGLYGHYANVCTFAGDYYASTNSNFDRNEGCHPPWNDPYFSTYNPEWENHHNSSWQANFTPPYAQYNMQSSSFQPYDPPYAQYNMQSSNFHPYDPPYAQYQMQSSSFPTYPSRATLEESLNSFIQGSKVSNQPRKPTLEETLNAFIQSTSERMESIEASMKRIEMQVGQLAEQIQKQEELPTQIEQVKDDTILQSGKNFENIYFPETFDDLPFCVENTDGEQAILKECQAKEYQIPQTSMENMEELSSPPMPHKAPKTCTSPNYFLYHFHKKVCAVLHGKQLPRWKDKLNDILAQKIDITHFKIFDDGG